jgi:hypothetical protein
LYDLNSNSLRAKKCLKIKYTDQKPTKRNPFLKGLKIEDGRKVFVLYCEIKI